MRLRIALLALPLALVACGGSSSNSGGSDQSASSTACPKGAVVIHMANIKFAPEKATAKPGQTVCWINDDTVQHDATADGQQFHSALFGKSKTFSWKAAGSGAVKYVCTVHPGMDGEIDVTR